MKPLFLFVSIVSVIESSCQQSKTQIDIDTTTFEKYAYRIIVGHPDSLSNNSLSGTGFFVQYKNRPFFVSAGHIFAEDNLETMRSQFFTVQVTDVYNKPWNLIADFSKPPGKLWRYKIGGIYADVALFEMLYLPPNVNLNYVEIFQSDISDYDVTKGATVFLPGFPAGTNGKSIIHASILYSNLLDSSKKNAIIYTQDTAQRGMSGAPLFLVKKVNNRTLSKAIGVCSGHDNTGDMAYRGIYYHIGIVEGILKRLIPE